MAEQETIAAIATPPGEGGIGVIRLSGPGALEALEPICDHSPESLTPRQAELTNFYLPPDRETVDQGLVTYFPAPNSYTGETVVECSCHGSPLLLQKLLTAILENSRARLANPGEFTRRAFTNDKLDLAEASAVGELISARSEAALKASARQLTGELSETLNELRQTIIEARSQLEASLDFADQDSVTELPNEALGESLGTVVRRLEKLIDSGQIGQLFAQGSQLAIVGRPNVGKSSLFNLLLKQDRAIVTTQPGTTRDVLREEISLEGIPITLHDTAGIHRSPEEVEAQGVERSETAINTSDLALLLVDAQTAVDEADRHIQQLLNDSNTPYLLIANKIDLAEDVPDDEIESALDRQIDCQLSVKEQQGLDKLESKIVQKLSDREVSTAQPLVTQTRHLQILKKTRKFLEQARSGLEADEETTLVAEDLRMAGEELGKITGEITTDSVLDQIFSSFCIGK